jgi:hypothetical protein
VGLFIENETNLAIEGSEPSPTYNLEPEALPQRDILERNNHLLTQTMDELWTELGGKGGMVLEDIIELLDSEVATQLQSHIDEILSGDAVSWAIARELLQEGDTNSPITAIYGAGENVNATLERYQIVTESPQYPEDIKPSDLEKLSAELLTAATMDILPGYISTGESRLDIKTLVDSYKEAKDTKIITSKDTRENFVISLELTKLMSELISNLILYKNKKANIATHENG